MMGAFPYKYLTATVPVIDPEITRRIVVALVLVAEVMVSKTPESLIVNPVIPEAGVMSVPPTWDRLIS